MKSAKRSYFGRSVELLKANSPSRWPREQIEPAPQAPLLAKMPCPAGILEQQVSSIATAFRAVTTDCPGGGERCNRSAGTSGIATAAVCTAPAMWNSFAKTRRRTSAFSSTRGIGGAAVAPNRRRYAELRYHHAGRPALTLQWRFSLGQEAVSNGRTLRTCHPGFLEDVTAGTCQPHCAVKHLG